MTIRILASLGLGTALLLAADGPMPELQVSHTDRAEFPSGGTLKLVNSAGAVTVEAWDQPGIEITTIKYLQPGYAASDRDKATHELESLHIKVERSGNKVVVTTESPKHSGSNVEYHIKAPAAANFIADQHSGEVNVDGLTSDIDVTLRRGQISLHLPEDGKYNTSAKVDLGTVNTDYPGQVEQMWWRFGHRVETGNSTATHKLNLKVGYGDIVILKMQVPKPPESKATGL